MRDCIPVVLFSAEVPRLLMDVMPCIVSGSFVMPSNFSYVMGVLSYITFFDVITCAFLSASLYFSKRGAY